MKKSIMDSLIVAGALLLFGAGLFAGAMSAGAWEFDLLSLWNFETHTYDIDQPFANISIESDTADIYFEKSNDGKCRVECMDYEYNEYESEVRDGTLFIKLDDVRKWYQYITINVYPKANSITVYLPEDAYETLTVRESTGDVNIPDYFTFESLELEVSTGDVTVCCDTAGTCSITTGTGDVEVQSASVGALAIRTSSGEITVTDVACAGNASVNVSTGKVFMTNLTCQDLTTTGGTGDITLKNVIASGNMDIERGTGDVNFDGSDAANIKITTTTGNVTGSLLSDKIFVHSTATGRVQLPQTTTGGTCHITTNTGDIDIKIQ